MIRPVPARLVFLSGAYKRITDAIDSHVQPGCDPGDDDNNGQVGARVLQQIKLPTNYARTPETAWTTRARPGTVVLNWAFLLAW